MTQPPAGPQQPYQQGPHPQQVGAQPLQSPPREPKRFGFLALGVAALAGLVLGSCSGAIAAGGDPATTTAAPAATVTAAAPTVTVTAPAEPAAAEPTGAPAEGGPAEEYVPKPSDFKIGIKIRDKECFGSAGCNVTYRIDPEYVGDQPLPNGEIEVAYEVSGAEDEIISLFTISDGSASFDEEEDTSTSSSGAKLEAKVTDVSVS